MVLRKAMPPYGCCRSFGVCGSLQERIGHSSVCADMTGDYAHVSRYLGTTQGK